mmetsp:Transcript_9715/g.24141  ORF Transcript_9715/g.24141 Transcript_9715/m.24141 type:complete len:351 (+) Transcript_9715:1284-2336(+)
MLSWVRLCRAGQCVGPSPPAFTNLITDTPSVLPDDEYSTTIAAARSNLFGIRPLMGPQGLRCKLRCAKPSSRHVGRASLYNCSSSVSYATAATSSNVGPQNAVPATAACIHTHDSSAVVFCAPMGRVHTQMVPSSAPVATMSLVGWMSMQVSQREWAANSARSLPSRRLMTCTLPSRRAATMKSERTASDTAGTLAATAGWRSARRYDAALSATHTLMAPDSSATTTWHPMSSVHRPCRDWYAVATAVMGALWWLNTAGARKRPDSSASTTYSSPVLAPNTTWLLPSAAMATAAPRANRPCVVPTPAAPPLPCGVAASGGKDHTNSRCSACLSQICMPASVHTTTQPASP